MRLKYLNFLFELEIWFWRAVNFKPCCLQHNILCCCRKLKIVLITPARIYKKRMAQAIRF